MELKELLRKFEGESLKPYPDTEGFMTIGVGWNMDANPLPEIIKDYLDKHGEITQDASDILLNESIYQATQNLTAVFGGIWGTYTENRRSALVSVMFNVGLGNSKKGFRSFKKMIAAIKVSDWDKAADELLNSKRTKQVGERAEIEARMLREG